MLISWLPSLCFNLSGVPLSQVFPGPPGTPWRGIFVLLQDPLIFCSLLAARAGGGRGLWHVWFETRLTDRGSDRTSAALWVSNSVFGWDSKTIWTIWITRRLYWECFISEVKVVTDSWSIALILLLSINSHRINWWGYICQCLLRRALKLLSVWFGDSQWIAPTEEDAFIMEFMLVIN